MSHKQKENSNSLFQQDRAIPHKIVSAIVAQNSFCLIRGSCNLSLMKPVVPVRVQYDQGQQTQFQVSFPHYYDLLNYLECHCL
jgi:hypothetical protein